MALAGLAGCGGGSSGSVVTTTQTGTGTDTGTGTGTGAGGTPIPTTPVTPTGGTTPAPVGDKVAVGPGCFAYTLTASPVLTGADPLLAQQWHLQNTGTNTGAPNAVAGMDLNVIPAWLSTRGAGTRVVVIDDAIEITHPDLWPNVVEGASRSYRPGNVGSLWPLPCSVSDEREGHGTSVAGLLAARDGNAIGVAGVAPRASLVAFDALAGGTEADIADALVRDSVSNAIYHNSWGSRDDAKLNGSSLTFRTAIRQGVDSGRGGKGAIYVFSAGNGNGLNDNSNFDGYVNVLGTSAVCAVDNGGRQAPYSEPGANLLVCAPSAGAVSNVVTTDLNGRYRSDFNGTSAAAPMVSGVVALMLAANPALTWRDVRLILARTARRVDTADVATPSSPTGWAPSALGPSVQFNHKYGFGVADAAAAVAAAKTWTSVGGSDTLKTCTRDAGTLALAIPDAGAGNTPGTSVMHPLVVSGCAISSIEWVEVEVTLDAGYSGDYRIDLMRPVGGGNSISRLASERVCPLLDDQGQLVLGLDNRPIPVPCGDYAAWRFGSARHMGETGDGTWTLSVTDMYNRDLGTLRNWSITLYGK
ncbi:MAG: Calcium-dependent protease precursor [Pseudomonadota bacterium]